jgi:hypothetical protein
MKGMAVSNPVPPLPRLLGFAGLLPQFAAVAVQVIGNPAYLFSAEALAFAYAALIFSFLGGMWWGIAAVQTKAPRWLYVAAVVPTLLALAAAWPWATGAAWPAPSLILLGAAILVTPFVDRRVSRLGIAPGWWMRLRVPLSVGLGGLTIVSGLLA